MTHSDDKGLVLPPTLAQDEMVVVPIFKNDNKAEVLSYAEGVVQALKADGRRVAYDNDDATKPGWKFAEWEMRGVPIRVETGPKDMAEGNVVMVRRDTGEKLVVKVAEAPAKARELLAAIQDNLREKARAFRDANTKRVKDYEQIVDFFGSETAGTSDAPGGFADGLWCGGRDCEANLKANLKVTIRNMPANLQHDISGVCCLCGKPAMHRAIFARSY